MTTFRKIMLFGLVCLSSLPLFAEPMRISVSVPGPGAASYLPVELIARIGADQAEGAQLDVRFVSGGGIAIEELLNNNADFAVLGLPAAMSARLKDKRVVALAAVNDLPLYVLLVREELRGKVKTIADLKGKTIGVHSNSLTTKTNSHQLLELVLKRNGVPSGSYRVVTVGQRWESEEAMLASGAADAIMGDEPHAARMVANKTAFQLLHLGDPQSAKAIPGGAFLRGTLIGRNDKLEQEPKKYETMVRIMRRTLQWIASHTPDEIVAQIDITDAAQKRFLLETLRKYPRQYSKDGKFSSRQLQDTELFFHESQSGNPAAQALQVESMVVDRWAGRSD